MSLKKTPYDILVELLTDWEDGGRLDLLIDAILADTGELQTDWADGGRLDLLIDDILLDTGTTIPGTITTMQGNVTDILADTGELQTDWVDGGRLDLLIDAIKAVTDAIPDAGALTALLADITDILLDTGTTIPGTITTMQGNVTDILADTGELQTDWADGGRLDLLIDAIKAVTDALPDAGALTTIGADVDPKVMGRLQIKATTIELNQVVGDYDLFTGMAEDVVIEKLTIRIPEDVSGGNMDSLSIQTDDTTNQVFISAANGAKVNLTAQAQLGWTGVTLLKATKKIQLTIAGAATGIACSCDVIAECRAVVAGGYLA